MMGGLLRLLLIRDALFDLLKGDLSTGMWKAYWYCVPLCPGLSTKGWQYYHMYRILVLRDIYMAFGSF